METREETILNGILPFIKETEGIDYNPPEFIGSKNTSIKFLLLPQWSAMFVPFNIAKLSSIAKSFGYPSSCLDLNIKIHNRCKELMDSGDLDYYPWDGPRNFKWWAPHYQEELHPLISDIIEDYIEKIVKENPKVIGFTLYRTNMEPSLWMLSKLRERLPDSIFIAGGPSTHSELPKLNDVFDIIVIGEAEQILLEVLDKVENQIQMDFPMVLTQPENQRLNLEKFPIPDYSDFNISEYIVSNGILTEFSRGCIAKCSFCEETHFWKYRQRNYITVVDEIEYLYKNRGVNLVWFLDSLVNGDLKELKRFCEEIIRRNLKIQWFGYVRHDKRMDLNFYKLMKKSGATILTYGTESGSDKVLKDMNKRIVKKEIEQNFLDGFKVGIKALTGWVISFPTETLQDFTDTITLLWRNRRYITNIGSGPKFGPGPSTMVSQNPERYNMHDFFFEGVQITRDYKLAKPHMLIRAKSWFIFQLQIITDTELNPAPRPNLPKFHYTIDYHNKNLAKSIDFETFDYSIVKTNMGDFQDSLINHIFPLFRILWRTRGGYDMNIKFNPEIDYPEFGNTLVSNLIGEYNFSITDSGEWQCDMDIDYKQQENPFDVFDLSNLEYTATKRARKLAKPSWGMDGRNEEQINKLNQECDKLNKEIDFSFSYKDTIKGSWGIKKSLF